MMKPYVGKKLGLESQPDFYSQESKARRPMERKQPRGPYAEFDDDLDDQNDMSYLPEMEKGHERVVTFYHGPAGSAGSEGIVSPQWWRGQNTPGIMKTTEFSLRA